MPFFVLFCMNWFVIDELFAKTRFWLNNDNKSQGNCLTNT